MFDEYPCGNESPSDLLVLEIRAWLRARGVSDLGVAWRRARWGAALDLVEVSDLTGIALKVISRIERGLPPTVQEADLLRAAYGLPDYPILGGYMPLDRR